MAGEQLFQAAPREPERTGPPVVVTIRRSRLGAPNGEGLTPATSGGEMPVAPRVFRVETASNETVAEPPPVEPAAEPAPVQPASRRQRIGVDRRPGPVVVQVFQPEPQAAQPADADEVLPPFGEQIAVLQAQLAELDRALADLRRAASLRFALGA